MWSKSRCYQEKPYVLVSVSSVPNVSTQQLNVDVNLHDVHALVKELLPYYSIETRNPGAKSPARDRERECRHVDTREVPSSPREQRDILSSGSFLSLPLLFLRALFFSFLAFKSHRFLAILRDSTRLDVEKRKRSTRKRRKREREREKEARLRALAKICRTV